MITCLQNFWINQSSNDTLLIFNVKSCLTQIKIILTKVDSLHQ